MCSLCDDDGEFCQRCGRLICFDVTFADDILAPAYVTASGDLFCDRCGVAMDIADEEAMLEDGEYYTYPDPYDEGEGEG